MGFVGVEAELGDHLILGAQHAVVKVPLQADVVVARRFIGRGDLRFLVVRGLAVSVNHVERGDGEGQVGRFVVLDVLLSRKDFEIVGEN